MVKEINETFIKDENGKTVLLNSMEVIDTRTLPELKQAAIEAIDAETQANIFNGFVFDGVTFSMSLTAQINWSNFPNLPSQLFPLPVMGKNDEPYSLAESNKMDFYFTALNYKNQCLQAGALKKKAINACETIEDLKTIIE